MQEFYVPFKGTFRGRSYNADVPPRMLFPNSSSCNNFRDFVAQTILERVANGSLLVWGEVGKVDPPSSSYAHYGGAKQASHVPR